MKFLKHLSTYLLCAVLVLLPMSCQGPLPFAQGSALKTEVHAQVKAGDISPELGAYLIAEIDKRMDPNYSGGIDWDLVLKSGGGIALSVISALTGVRLVRGPAKPMDKSQAEILNEIIADWTADDEDDEDLHAETMSREAMADLIAKRIEPPENEDV